MRKKFTVIDASTGQKVKLEKGQMIVMNADGIFFLVGGIGDYYPYISKLSDFLKKYDIIWNDGEDK